MSRFAPFPAFCMAVIFLIPASLLAATNSDRTQFRRDIRIEADDRVGDVTCVGCSIRVRGHVTGDVTAVAGSIFAESGAAIAGDVTAVGGSVHAENGSEIGGDLTTIGGTLRREPQAAVAGDVTTMGGGGWVFMIFLMPFLLIGGIIALIIWMIQRSRHPAPVPAYTLRRN